MQIISINTLGLSIVDTINLIYALTVLDLPEYDRYNNISTWRILIMNYIIINVPPYPFFVFSGDALYRPGDFHRKRSGIDCFDLLFVEYGSLHMKIENSHFHVKANDALIIPPDMMHEAYKVCEEKTHFHWLHFDVAGPYQISHTFNNDIKPQQILSGKKNYTGTLVLPIFQSISETDAADIIQVMTRLESLSNNRYVQSSLLKKDGNFNTPLQQQAQFLNVISYFTVPDEQQKAQEIAPMLMRYLQVRYATDISLNDMAKIANCHPTHVIRCFNKRYGVTPAKALMNIRLQQAKRLLETTDLTCEKIAYEVGLSSSSYFSRLFKKHYMMTPNDCRNARLTTP